MFSIFFFWFSFKNNRPTNNILISILEFFDQLFWNFLKTKTLTHGARRTFGIGLLKAYRTCVYMNCSVWSKKNSTLHPLHCTVYSTVLEVPLLRFWELCNIFHYSIQVLTVAKIAEYQRSYGSWCVQLGKAVVYWCGRSVRVRRYTVHCPKSINNFRE